MEWINVKDKLPDNSTVLIVRRENGSKVKAYFHKDKMQWLQSYYDGELSHFQDHATRKFLFDVTHWMK